MSEKVANEEVVNENMSAAVIQAFGIQENSRNYICYVADGHERNNKEAVYKWVARTRARLPPEKRNSLHELFDQFKDQLDEFSDR